MALNSSYSLETGEKRTFHVYDYVVFSVVLVVSAVIGVVLAYRDRHKTNIKQFLLAGQKTFVVPVSLSLLSSFVSAITILGTPSEMYIFGTMFIYFGISYGTSLIFAAHLYIPIFYQCGVTSAYEYLELRFNRFVRTVCSVAYCCQTILLMAIVLYAPSLALNAVTGLNLWGTVCGVGIVCTLYTMLVTIMFIGLIVVLVQGAASLGGFTRAWDIAADRGRIQFEDFDPTVRHSFWALTVGGTFTSLAIYGTNQSQVQRSLTLPSIRKAKIAIWLNLPLKFLLVNLCALVGIVMFAFYADCDPLSSKIVSHKDQLLPLFVMDVLADSPGVPGLFVAVLFAGALSTVSSGLNSMSAAIMQDIVRPFVRPNIAEKNAVMLAKVISAVLGLVSLALSYVASRLGGVLQAAITLDGLMGGTLLGVFTLGMVFPWANSAGAFAGFLTSVSFLLWINVGQKVTSPTIHRGPLPVNTSGCQFITGQNVSSVTPVSVWNSTAALTYDTSDGLGSLYTISYLYYAVIAVIVTCLVGLVVSLLTGPTKPESLDPKLMCPFFDVYFPCLPEKIRRPLRFGVLYTKQDVGFVEIERVEFKEIQTFDS